VDHVSSFPEFSNSQSGGHARHPGWRLGTFDSTIIPKKSQFLKWICLSVISSFGGSVSGGGTPSLSYQESEERLLACPPFPSLFARLQDASKNVPQMKIRTLPSRKRHISRVTPKAAPKITSSFFSAVSAGGVPVKSRGQGGNHSKDWKVRDKNLSQIK